MPLDVRSDPPQEDDQVGEHVDTSAARVVKSLTVLVELRESLAWRTADDKAILQGRPSSQQRTQDVLVHARHTPVDTLDVGPRSADDLYTVCILLDTYI
jgi:hypothetical protein